VQKSVPEACDLRNRMTYARATADAGVFTIPESTEKLYLAVDGRLYRNRISYQGCRQYTAESAISFGDEASPQTPLTPQSGEPELPAARTPLHLRLTSKIDSDRNSAGDPIEAKLVSGVSDSQGHTLPAGAVFRGHIAQMEHNYASPQTVVIALRFDSVVLNGSPVSVKLGPAGWEDEKGRQIFRFHERKVLLDSRFVSSWLFVR
jgi:hypothetical protein